MSKYFWQRDRNEHWETLPDKIILIFKIKVQKVNIFHRFRFGVFFVLFLRAIRLFVIFLYAHIGVYVFEHINYCIFVSSTLYDINAKHNRCLLWSPTNTKRKISPFFLKPVRKWSGSAVKPTRAELVVSSCDLLITYSNEINEARSVAVNASALARWPQAELF